MGTEWGFKLRPGRMGVCSNYHAESLEVVAVSKLLLDSLLFFESSALKAYSSRVEFLCQSLRHFRV